MPAMASARAAPAISRIELSVLAMKCGLIW